MSLIRSALTSAIGFAVGSALFMFPAHAQVNVHLTTDQQKNCVASTDANGLTLVPGSADLQATGVVLTGDGCGTAGADFQALLSVSPTSVTSGSPATVTWSAGQPATRCMYTGSTGLSGWPVGTVACQGTSCAQQHTKTITPSAAGSHDVSVTCTNDTGYRDAVLTATTPPLKPQPDNFALTATPTGVNVNTAFQVSWSVTGATSCVGTAKLNDQPLSTLLGWTTVNTATSPRSVTPAQSGTYKLKLACSNEVGTSNSTELSVVVTDPTQACTVPGLTRKITGRIEYPNVINGGARTNMDLRKFESIWGAGDSTAPIVTEWPGAVSQPAIVGWARSEFIAAGFIAPAAVAHKFQMINMAGYNSDVMTLAVSTTCGDFNPTNPLCVSTQGPGESFKKISEAGCPLTPGTEYFINVKYANPTGCGASCRIQLQSSIGDW